MCECKGPYQCAFHSVRSEPQRDARERSVGYVATTSGRVRNAQTGAEIVPPGRLSVKQAMRVARALNEMES